MDMPKEAKEINVLKESFEKKEFSNNDENKFIEPNVDVNVQNNEGNTSENNKFLKNSDINNQLVEEEKITKEKENDIGISNKENINLDNDRKKLDYNEENNKENDEI